MTPDHVQGKRSPIRICSTIPIWRDSLPGSALGRLFREGVAVRGILLGPHPGSGFGLEALIFLGG
jgi:hypothetical protein